MANSLQFRVITWMQDNSNEINQALNKGSALSDELLLDLVSRYKADTDLTFISYYLFDLLVARCFALYIHNDKTFYDFERCVRKLAGFSSLYEYAKEVDSDDLMNRLPFVLFKNLFKEVNAVNDRI